MSTVTTAEPTLTLPPPQNGDDVLYEIVNGQYLRGDPFRTRVRAGDEIYPMILIEGG